MMTKYMHNRGENAHDDGHQSKDSDSDYNTNHNVANDFDYTSDGTYADLIIIIKRIMVIMIMGNMPIIMVMALIRIVILTIVIITLATVMKTTIMPIVIITITIIIMPPAD